MTRLHKISDRVHGSLDLLAEGWQDLWNRAKHAITRFTPVAEDHETGGNRWGLLSAELHESKDGVTVSVEAPGLNKEDFEIFVNGRTLAVRGAKRSSSDRVEGRYHITERAYGRFERLLSLPAEVDESGTRASYRNGVLTIEMSKLKEARPRVISVS